MTWTVFLLVILALVVGAVFGWAARNSVMEQLHDCLPHDPERCAEVDPEHEHTYGAR